jgi:fumarate reductase flavoprotein subunit
MRRILTDVLVVGGGLAGQRTAIGAKRRGHDVIVLSLVPPKRSHSAAAQGGMQASLGNTVMGAGDSEDVHFADTVRGSDWGADQDVVRMFVETAPKAVRELAQWGVPWNRVQRGERAVVINGQRRTITERDDAHGLITARDFGGTKKWRTSFVSDGTGHSMLYTVSNQAIALQIPVHERMEAMALIHDAGRCHGVIARNLMNGELVAYVAKATVIATGGFGRIYSVSTNALINEGMGAAIAVETGEVALGNMEAVQFHPTAIFPASILVTEGCRGDGGLLRDASGHRFMPDYEPEKQELASRDVVSRRIEEHITKGHGARNRYGEHVWLDITLLGERHINQRLREVKEICQYFLGIDPARDYIPVRPAQHYSMGGIRTDHRGESAGLRGLFACGEAACWDLHGFNRLGGNSVAETVVAGMIVGETVSDYCDDPANDVAVSVALIREFRAREEAALHDLVEGNGDQDAAAIGRRMRDLMTEKVGIFRDGYGLQQALDELLVLSEQASRIGLRSRSLGANPELVGAYRLRRMLRLALTVTLGALRRTESRGAHYRVDHPRRNDAQWLNRTLATWPDAADPLPTLAYEALDVRRMEMPPGWRGYGANDHIPHPDAAARQAEVDALKRQQRDPDAVEAAVGPFRGQLPEGLRGRNARLGAEAS